MTRRKEQQFIWKSQSAEAAKENENLAMYVRSICVSCTNECRYLSLSTQSSKNLECHRNPSSSNSSQLCYPSAGFKTISLSNYSTFNISCIMNGIWIIYETRQQVLFSLSHITWPHSHCNWGEGHKLWSSSYATFVTFKSVFLKHCFFDFLLFHVLHSKQFRRDVNAA